MTRRRTWIASAAAMAGGFGMAGCAPARPLRARTPLDSLGDGPAQLPGTTQADWHDPDSGHTWRVWVQAPAAPAPAGGHPVLVLPDGNATFALAAQLARNSASRPAELRPDPLVVIAIGHPGDAPYDHRLRQRDYTPPAPGALPAADRGGADRWLDFVAQQVLPRVRAALPVDDRRLSFFGHSYGGLLGVQALLTRPALFTRCATASPSLWWNGAQVMREVDAFVQRHAAPSTRPFQVHLQLRVGGDEHADAAATPERARVQRERHMIAHARTLAERLQATHWPELDVDFAVLPGLDHGAVMLPALVDAIALAQRPAAPPRPT
ncbi:alpha/beta hydrolase [Hydrogenophaga sp. NFH-34]|uniref:alpha/beta hydrolase n=1 Tax=Hydrogenophaga sp. NFH-34 TaxID=2744446 RepID=UPI001EEA3A8F|nr:alpha/beta hydrolase-fold protein [Hydrogenophaga sp. NFH-34]